MVVGSSRHNSSSKLVIQVQGSVAHFYCRWFDMAADGINPCFAVLENVIQIHSTNKHQQGVAP